MVNTTASDIFETPTVIIAAGLDASGKSTVSQALHEIFGFHVVEKDDSSLEGNKHTIALARELGDSCDVYTTEEYQKQFRPLIYNEVFNNASTHIKGGESCIIVAPFGSEARNSKALSEFDTKLRNGNNDLVFDIAFLWFRCSAQKLEQNMCERNAERDRGKFPNWEPYIDSIDFSFKPSFQHILIDTTKIPLQATQILAQEIVNTLQKNTGTTTRIDNSSFRL